MNGRPLVVIPDDISGSYAGFAGLDRLRAVADVRVLADKPSGPEDLAARIRPADAILSFRPAFTRFSADVLAAGERLKLVSISGTGLEDVDVAEASRRGIAVANVPGPSDRSVAELAIALMFAVARHVAQHDRGVRAGAWQATQGIELGGKTLGIVGLSAIGRELARLAGGIGMRVLSCSRNNDPARAATVGAESVSMERLLVEADVVSIHVRLNEETRGMFGAERIAGMKPGSILINTARGPVVDEAALIGALAQGHLRGAGLDVFAEEPLPAGHPLTQLENVVLSPVAGWNTADASDRMLGVSIENVIGFFAGTPQNVRNQNE